MSSDDEEECSATNPEVPSKPLSGPVRTLVIAPPPTSEGSGAKNARPPVLGDANELASEAEQLRYSTRIACKTYLGRVPSELETAMTDLLTALIEREVWTLTMGIRRLTAMLDGYFGPDGPHRPRAAQARLPRSSGRDDE